MIEKEGEGDAGMDKERRKDNGNVDIGGDIDIIGQNKVATEGVGKKCTCSYNGLGVKLRTCQRCREEQQ